VPGLGTAVYLGLFTPLGGLGVWIGLLAGLVVVAALLMWRWYNRDNLGLLPADRSFLEESALAPS
jgi:MATE family multidrug resistance protein